MNTPLAVAALIYNGVVYFLFGMSAQGSSSYPTFFKLMALPWLFIIPFSLALEEKDEKKRLRYFLGAFLLAPLVALVMFWGTLSEKYQQKKRKNEVITEYKTALATADSDPARAYLACFLAQPYRFSEPNDAPHDCSIALKSVSDAKFCRTLCPEAPSVNTEPCSTDTSSVIRDCARIMISKMNFDSPYDVCKMAGLLNYRRPATRIDQFQGYSNDGPDDYFHGHYIECLEENVRNEKNGQYKTLGELLKINYKKIPTHTRKPLPE